MRERGKVINSWKVPYPTYKVEKNLNKSILNILYTTTKNQLMVLYKVTETYLTYMSNHKPLHMALLFSTLNSIYLN